MSLAEITLHGWRFSNLCFFILMWNVLGQKFTGASRRWLKASRGVVSINLENIGMNDR